MKYIAFCNERGTYIAQARDEFGIYYTTEFYGPGDAFRAVEYAEWKNGQQDEVSK